MDSSKRSIVLAAWAAIILIACGASWAFLRHGAPNPCDMTFSWAGGSAFRDVPLRWKANDMNSLNAQSGTPANANNSSLAYKYSLWQWTSAGPGHARLYSRRPAHCSQPADGSILPCVTPGSLPVLFVPGHGGSYRQARSLGAALADQADVQQSQVQAGVVEQQEGSAASPLAIELFSLHFGKETTALLGHAAVDQATAVADAILTIRSLYRSEGKDRGKGRARGVGRKHAAPLGIVIVAHSMGGLAARAAVLDKRLQEGSVSAIITLGTPAIAAPVDSDAGLRQWYMAVNRAWMHAGISKSNTTLGPAGISLLALSVGEADLQVWEPSTRMVAFLPVVDSVSAQQEEVGGEGGPSLLAGLPWAWTTSAVLPGLRASLHHVASTWCAQIIRPLAGALEAYAHAQSACIQQPGTEGSDEFQTPVLACESPVSRLSILWDELHSAAYVSTKGNPGATAASGRLDHSSGASSALWKVARVVSLVLFGIDVLPSSGSSGPYRPPVTVPGVLAMLPMRLAPAVVTVACMLLLWVVGSTLLSACTPLVALRPLRPVMGGIKVESLNNGESITMAQALDPLQLRSLALTPLISWYNALCTVIPQLLDASADWLALRLGEIQSRPRGGQESSGKNALGPWGAYVKGSIVAAAVAVYCAGTFLARPGSWGSADTHTPIAILLLAAYPTAVAVLMLVDAVMRGVGAVILFIATRCYRCVRPHRGLELDTGAPQQARVAIRWRAGAVTAAVVCLVCVSTLIGVRSRIFCILYRSRDETDGIRHLDDLQLPAAGAAQWLSALALGLLASSVLLLLWSSTAAANLRSISGQSLSGGAPSACKATDTSRASLFISSLGVLLPLLVSLARIGDVAHFIAILSEPRSIRVLSQQMGRSSDLVWASWGVSCAAAVVLLQVCALRIGLSIASGSEGGLQGALPPPPPLPLPVPDEVEAEGKGGEDIHPTPPLPRIPPPVSHGDCPLCIHEAGGQDASYYAYNGRVRDRAREGECTANTVYRVDTCGCWRRAAAVAAAGKIKLPSTAVVAPGPKLGAVQAAAKEAALGATLAYLQAPSSPYSAGGANGSAVGYVRPGCGLPPAPPSSVAAVIVRRLESLPAPFLRALVCDYCACTCPSCGGESMARNLLQPPPPPRPRHPRQAGQGEERGQGDGGEVALVREVMGTLSRVALAGAGLLLCALSWACVWLLGAQRASALPPLLIPAAGAAICAAWAAEGLAKLRNDRAA